MVNECAGGDRLRLLHFHAHPDDESSKGAASTVRYVREGIQVVVATFTGGERGSVLNPKMMSDDVVNNLSVIRRKEMERARRILGIDHVSLGFIDSGFPEDGSWDDLPEGCFARLDPDEAAVEAARVIRSLRPHVVTTYDEAGGYPHPDHIQTHRVTMRAIRLAADDVRHDLGMPYQVPKVYYQTSFHRRRYLALDAAMRSHGYESPYEERLGQWEDVNYEHRITTKVECSEYFPIRDEALRAHASQVDPDGMWFAVPTEIQQEAWPTEDFQLVYSAVPTVIPEDDLFSGLREYALPSFSTVLNKD